LTGSGQGGGTGGVVEQLRDPSRPRHWQVHRAIVYFLRVCELTIDIGTWPPAAVGVRNRRPFAFRVQSRPATSRRGDNPILQLMGEAR
jgi:hypothetical protein